MIDAERMLGSLVRSAMGGGRGLGRSGRRRGRRSRRSLPAASKGALALGALGVAIAAFEHFSQKKAAAPATPPAPGAVPPAPPPPPRAEPPPLPPLPTNDAAGTAAAAAPPPPDPRLANEDALLLVRAMIAAANADHELDDEERGRILGALEEADAGKEEKEYVRRELEEPMGLAALAAAASTPELASQIYLASCLAIEIDTAAERNYLDRLAHRLGLDRERARALEATLAPADEDET